MYPDLVAFDIDGTLLPDTTIARHMAAYLDDLPLIEALEDGWARQEVGHREFAVQSARAYRGRGLGEMDDVASSLPVIAGADEAIGELIAHGSKVILATMSMAFAGRVLADRFGCHHVRGTELAHDGETYGGTIARFSGTAAKPEFILAYAERHGIEPERIAAVGDFRRRYSDVPGRRPFGRAERQSDGP